MRLLPKKKKRTTAAIVGRCAARLPGLGVVLLLGLASTACTTLPSAPLVRDQERCQAWTATLDAAIAAAGVADAEAERIEGVPGLRVDRIGQALGAQALQDDAAWAAWLARAAQLDALARRAEIANLPTRVFPLGLSPAYGLATVPDGAAALARSGRCRELAVQQLQGSDGAAASAAPGGDPSPRPALLAAQRSALGSALGSALIARARVPDRYSTTSRALGLYPLLRWPFFAGVSAWQEGHTAVMRRWSEAPPALRRFVPASVERGDAAPAATAAPQAIEPAWAITRDALGLPQPTASVAQRLLEWHAPVFEIEDIGAGGSPDSGTAFDRFGAPTWAGPDDAPMPRVDPSTPVVYTRLAHTRFEGRWLLQLVYALWFPERPARSALDLLAGALDGVVVRLTLDEDGQPLLMDTIHACGCYHLFFPAATLRARDDGPQSEEWLFAPAALPPLGRDARLVVRIASGTHYVSGLAALARGPGPEASLSIASAPGRYVLRDDEGLRSLPLSPAGSGRRSLYGPDGLVAGSERGERFLFWPMGIASAGAMRQWGHHATAFVGRRHFDEVDLIGDRFVRARR